jgi:RIO kinase 1
MDEVLDYERDFRRAKEGETLIYTTLHGLKEDLSKPRQMPDILENALTTNVDSVACLNQPDKKLTENISKINKDESDSSETNSSSDDESTSDEESECSDDDQNKNSTDNIYYRPRDESPNSKKVLVFK